MIFEYDNNIEQYFSVFVSLLFIAGNYFLGRTISNKFFSDFRLGTSFFEFHYIVIGNVFLNIVLQYVVFTGFWSTAVMKVLAYLFLLWGAYSIYISKSKLMGFIGNFFAFIVKANLTFRLIVFLLLGFFLLALAPITNGDALDYHLGVPQSIIREGHFFWQPTWFHQGLSGLGEYSILLSLVIKAEQAATLLQLAALFSIIALFFHRDQSTSPKSSSFRDQLILLFLSIPVLLFLASTPKPQLVGVAISSFLFSKIILRDIPINKKNLFIIFALSFYIVAVKINFIFSISILIGIFLLKNRIFFLRQLNLTGLVYLLIFILCFILILGPLIYYKTQIMSGGILSYIYPIPDHYPGYELFLKYLREYDDVKLIFPLSLIVPSSLGVHSMVLGLNTLLVFYFLIKHGFEWRYLIGVVLLVVLSYAFGQRTSRFYFEALLWLMLVISLYSKLFQDSLVIRSSIHLLALGQLIILAYGIITLTSGIISLTKRDEVMSMKANGYSLSKWVNSKLDDSSKILIDHRATALFKQDVYSADWSYFVDKGKGEDLFYLEYLKKRK